MLNSIAAYGHVVVGLPILAAWLLCYLPNLAVEKICGDREISTYYYMAKTIIEALIALLFAYYVFELLHVAVSPWISAILLGTYSLWKMAQNEAFMITFIVIGVILGHKLFPLLQPVMAQW